MTATTKTYRTTDSDVIQLDGTYTLQLKPGQQPPTHLLITGATADLQIQLMDALIAAVGVSDSVMVEGPDLEWHHNHALRGLKTRIERLAIRSLDDVSDAALKTALYAVVDPSENRPKWAYICMGEEPIPNAYNSLTITDIYPSLVVAKIRNVSYYFVRTQTQQGDVGNGY